MNIKSWRRKGNWPIDKVKYTITLNASERLCRRKNLILDNGKKVLIALDKVVNFNDSDGFELENGEWIKINAAKEKIIDINTNDNEHQSLLAWHLGNRHLAMQIINEKLLRIEYDHVILDMLKVLNTRVFIREDIFEPELGAYGAHNH
tara:strand:+ start:164 stop:607 length:444 start_codon:yes stop_codon:yes gene_type:complete